MRAFATRKKTFQGLLRQKQRDLHLTAKRAAELMGFTPATYNRRIKSPGTITVAELQAFRKIYQLTDEEIADLVAGKYV
jgi:predicted transcriptional regulator